MKEININPHIKHSKEVTRKIYLFLLWKVIAITNLWLIAILVLFARKTDIKSLHKNQRDIPRRIFPDWLFFMSSPDEHLPGGMYEKTIAEYYDKYGYFITAVIWTGVRNAGQGILWDYGMELPKYPQHLSDAELAALGYFKRIKKVGPFAVISGFTVRPDNYKTKIKNNGVWATPTFSIRMWKQD